MQRREDVWTEWIAEGYTSASALLVLPNQCLVWLRSHTTLIGLKTKLLELSHVRLEQVGRVGRVIVLPVR